MTSRQLFAAIGNIDDRYIDEDADECVSTEKITKSHNSRAIYRYAGLAACAAVVLMCIWAIPALLNTPVENTPNNQASISSTDPHNGGQPENTTNLPSDSDTIIPGSPDEEWSTEPGEPTTPSQPAESNEIGDIAYSFGVSSTLSEVVIQQFEVNGYWEFEPLSRVWEIKHRFGKDNLDFHNILVL